MNATLIALVLLAQTPPAEAQPAPTEPAPAAAPAEGTPPAQDPNAPAAPPPADGAAPAATPPADGAAQPPAQDAPAAPATDASLPRASDMPLSETTTEQRIGRIVSGVVLGVGVALLVAGITGLGATAFLQFNPTRNVLPETPFNDDVVRTMSTITSAVAAGGLMLGLTCVLGGIFGVFVG